MEGPAPSPITRGSYLINTFIHQKFLPHHPDSFLIKFFIVLFYGFWNQVDNSLSNFKYWREHNINTEAQRFLYFFFFFVVFRNM